MQTWQPTAAFHIFAGRYILCLLGVTVCTVRFDRQQPITGLIRKAWLLTSPTAPPLLFSSFTFELFLMKDFPPTKKRLREEWYFLPYWTLILRFYKQFFTQCLLTGMIEELLASVDGELMGMIPVLVRLSISDIRWFNRRLMCLLKESQRCSLLFLHAAHEPLWLQNPGRLWLMLFLCPTSGGFTRLQKHSSSALTITFHFTTTLQIIVLLSLQENILPSLLTELDKDNRLPKAQRKLFIII